MMTGCTGCSSSSTTHPSYPWPSSYLSSCRGERPSRGGSCSGDGGEEEQQTASPEWPAVPNRGSDDAVAARGAREEEEVGVGNGLICESGAD